MKQLLWLASTIAAGSILTAATIHAEWKLDSSVTVKETYDNNVYLQQLGDLAWRESLVTSVAPSIGVKWSEKKEWNTTALIKYTPDFSFYHSEPEENNINHSWIANASGKNKNYGFDLKNCFTLIDGSNESPTFLAPGGIPAMGGFPIRDRRDAFIYKGDARVQWSAEPWFVRPVASAYVHNFLTVQKEEPGYENYVDRSDLNAGIDVGHKFMGDSYFVVGYRYGAQYQPELFDNPLEFSNTYHRVLVGVEGAPAKWLKVNAVIGPDFRSFNGHPPDDFDDNQIKVFVDATITFLPTKDDEICLLVRRFLQPSYCGRAIYEDITYQATFRHTFSPKLSGSLTIKDYEGDWQDPNTRNDRIITVGVSASYKVNEHLVLEAGSSLDHAESNVPDTAAREFDRGLFWAGVKYSF